MSSTRTVMLVRTAARASGAPPTTQQASSFATSYRSYVAAHGGLATSRYSNTVHIGTWLHIDIACLRVWVANFSVFSLAHVSDVSHSQHICRH